MDADQVVKLYSLYSLEVTADLVYLANVSNSSVKSLFDLS